MHDAVPEGHIVVIVLERDESSTDALVFLSEQVDHFPLDAV